MNGEKRISLPLEFCDEVYDLTIYEANYENNGTKALMFIDEDGDPFFELTTNIDGVENLFFSEDEICVKTWSENEPFINQLLATNVFEDTGRRVATGMTEASIWRYTPENILNPKIQADSALDGMSYHCVYDKFIYSDVHVLDDSETLIDDTNDIVELFHDFGDDICTKFGFTLNRNDGYRVNGIFIHGDDLHKDLINFKREEDADQLFGNNDDAEVQESISPKK